MSRNDAISEVNEKSENIIEQLSFKSRFVLIFGEINHTTARATCERLIALALESDDPIHAKNQGVRSLEEYFLKW